MIELPPETAAERAVRRLRRLTSEYADELIRSQSGCAETPTTVGFHACPLSSQAAA